MADKTYLDYAGLKLYDEKIKALIKDAGKSEGDIKAIIKEVVGALPEDATEATILAYLENKIKAVDDKVGDISSLTGDTIANLAQALSAEITRAGNEEQALEDKIGVASQAESADGAGDGVEATGLTKRIEDLEAAIGENGSVATQIEDAIDDLDLANTYAAKAYETKVDTLIGDDANKSVRTIANEELAKQLIADNAKESLDTLEEIAAWIQNHPDDAAAMSADIEALKTQVGTKAVAAVTHEATQEDVDAGKAAAVGETVIDTPAVAATGIEKEIADLDNSTDARLDALEIAAGLKGDDSEQTVAERVTAIENELSSADTFTAISEDQINALFTTAEEAV